MRSKPIRMKKPAKTAAHKDRARWWANPALITTAIIVLIGAAMLVAGVRSSPEAPNAESARAVEKAADRAEAKRLGMPAPPAPPRTANAAAHGEETDAGPAGLASAAAPVTITGCLERDDEMFRLRDASGAAVPKARSWKSGFLKKRTASIEVVDSGNRLTSHVGERVSLTGTLLDRKMTVRSLRRVAPSCDGSNSKT